VRVEDRGRGGLEQLDSILEMVAGLRGIDFRDYRRDTLKHRLEARMAAVGISDVGEYRRRLLEHAEEIDRLVESLVVPVTEFFRDAWVFRELSERVLPELLVGEPPLRAWVVGAASGEEAYSLAMLLEDAGAQYRIIASDLDEPSLRMARAGLYATDRVGEVPEELKDRYLRPEPGGYLVTDALRRRIQFARHDLMGSRLAPAEAILASFDLVLCRNVLLYFDSSLRARAVERLVSAVRPGGGLVLGSSETISSEALANWPGTRLGANIFQRSGP